MPFHKQEPAGQALFIHRLSSILTLIKIRHTLVFFDGIRFVPLDYEK